MLSGGKAIREALVTQAVPFADRPQNFYVNMVTNPRAKGKEYR